MAVGSQRMDLRTTLVKPAGRAATLSGRTLARPDCGWSWPPVIACCLDTGDPFCVGAAPCRSGACCSRMAKLASWLGSVARRALDYWVRLSEPAGGPRGPVSMPGAWRSNYMTMSVAIAYAGTHRAGLQTDR